jgi:hypothetical protein
VKGRISFRAALARAAWIAGAALAGCASPTPSDASRPLGPPHVGLPRAGAIQGVVEARFRVVSQPSPGGAERVLGFVARTRYAFPDGDLILWLVENDRMQDVGSIDQNGRAYRRVPFEDRPVWVATGSIADGVRALLRADDAVALERLEGEWSAASAERAASQPQEKPPQK